MILPLLLLALQDPVRIGPAEYTPPKGWEKDAKSDLWRRPGEDKNQFFLWIGPRAAGGDALEKHVETVMAALDAKTGAKEKKGSGFQKVDLATKFPAVARGRELEAGTSTFCSLEAAIRVGDDVYLLIFYTPDATKYSEIVRRDIEPMLNSLKLPAAGFEWGRIQFQPPEGWAADPKSLVWSKDYDTFSWHTPFPVGDAKVDALLARLRKPEGEVVKVGRSSGPTAVKTKGGVAGVLAFRELLLKGRSFPDYVFEALLISGGLGHYLRYSTTSTERYREVTEKVLLPMLDSASEFRPGAARDGGAVALPKATGTTFTRCFVTTAVPAAWKEPENEQERAYHFRWLVVKPLKGDVKVSFPVVWEARAGEFADVRTALRGWMETRMRPLAGERGNRLTMRRVTKFVTYRRDDGAEITAMGISDQYGDAVVAVHDAFVLRQNGCALFVGTSCGPHETWGRVSKELADPAWKLYEETRNEMWAAGVGAKLALPAAQESWTTWLVEKKTYRYFNEWSYSTSDTLNGFYTYSSGYNQYEWDFHGDRTCEGRHQSSSAFSFYGYDTSKYTTPLDVMGGAWGNEDENTGRVRFEVRGKDESDLWIVVWSAGGATIHAMNPKATGEFRKSRPEGLSIDGRIEGKYGSSNDYGYWKPAK